MDFFKQKYRSNDEKNQKYNFLPELSLVTNIKDLFLVASFFRNNTKFTCSFRTFAMRVSA